jgi:hypothetical protein
MIQPRYPVQLLPAVACSNLVGFMCTSDLPDRPRIAHQDLIFADGMGEVVVRDMSAYGP